MKRVVDFFQTLNRRGVRYCHWKSNLRLEWGLLGKTDLDLLVDDDHSRIFKKTLAEYQIVPVLAPPGKRYPATENYIGFDPDSGRLFHLHVHYELVLGEQFVKNYQLPLAGRFLDSVRVYQGVKVPAPELELIVLSMRSLLKYRDRDVIKDVLSIRSPGLPAHILEEIHWLLAQTSLDQVSQVLDEIAGIVPREIVVEFLKTVISSPRAGQKLYRLRQGVRQALSAYQRHSRVSASLQYLREMWRRRNSFLRVRPGAKMTLAPKGLALALVGVDGAGKTTLCREVTGWLSWKLDVRLYYLGSKQPSPLSRWLYLLFRMARRGHRTFAGRLGEKNAISRRLEALRQGLLNSHTLAIGRDRYRRYVAGRENARTGAIVIYDRFPLEARLDGPKIHLAANGNKSFITTTFARLEQNLYSKFQAPDLLVILEVSPEISMARKPDHLWQAIEMKNQMLGKLTAEFHENVPESGWVRVNADLELEDVLGALKREIWQALSSGQRVGDYETR